MAVPPFPNLTIPEGPQDSFLAGASILLYQRVQLNSAGQVLPANNVADLSFGVAVQPIANGAVGAVRLDYTESYGLSNTLINVGDTVYLAANGVISSASSNNAQVGVARTPTIAPAANSGNTMVPLVYLRVPKSA